jgi:hypothetical protein
VGGGCIDGGAGIDEGFGGGGQEVLARAEPGDQAWEESGQGPSRFAARHGLKAAPGALVSRLGKVRREAARQRGAAPGRFHPVELVGNAPGVETSAIGGVLDGRRESAGGLRE